MGSLSSACRSCLGGLHTAFAHVRQRVSNSNRSHLFLCFLIPAFLMTLVYACLGTHPFGRSSVLVLDLNGQYVQFFVALRDAIYGDGSLLYSFKRSLGGEFVGIYAYYLASPFSYIVALFPRNAILGALYFIFVLKAGCCGLTMGIFLHVRGFCRRLPSVAFSVMYALSSYVVAYQHNTMWIDCVIWLPLLALGIEQLIRYRRFALFVTSLAMSLLSNFYIGYMMCIFTAIYFFYTYFSGSAYAENNPTGERAHFLRSLCRIAFYSGIAVGIACLIIFPAAYSLSFGKNTFSVADFTPALKFGAQELVAKLFATSYDTVRPNGLPWLYCGTLALLIIPYYFLSNKFSLRERIGSLVILLLLIASMAITTTDLIWHGFQAPNWLNYRYSFMFSFLLLGMAAKAYTASGQGTWKYGHLIIGGAWLGLVFYLWSLDLSCATWAERVNHYFPFIFTVLMNIICIAGLTAFLFLRARLAVKHAVPRFFSWILIGAVSLEAVLNGIYCTAMQNSDVTISSYDSYHNFYDSYQDAVDRIKENDETLFYRMEKNEHRNTNDPMALGFYGMSNSTSTLNKTTIRFLAAMGVHSVSHYSQYSGGTPVFESLFGIRYLLSDKQIADPIYYTEEYGNGKVTAYRNNYVLSIATAASSSIKTLRYYYPSSSELNETISQPSISPIRALADIIEQVRDGGSANRYEDFCHTPFERTNEILGAMLGASDPIRVYRPLSFARTLHGMSRTGGAYHDWYTVKNSNDENERHYIEYKIIAEQDGGIYFYPPSAYPRQFTLRVLRYTADEAEDGERATEVTLEKTVFESNSSACSYIHLGNFDAGEEFFVEIEPSGGQTRLYFSENTDFFWYIDGALYESTFRSLQNRTMQVSQFKEDYIAGTIRAEGGNHSVFTTIPYDAGWHVLVNGEETETYVSMNALLAFDLPDDGTYEIELRYLPDCYLTGLRICLISLFVFALCLFVAYLLRRRKPRLPRWLRYIVATFFALPDDEIIRFADPVERFPDENNLSEHACLPSSDESASSAERN